MKSKTFAILALLSVVSFAACSLNSKSEEHQEVTKQEVVSEAQEQVPHRYGGWYCPDNLHGFPAINIRDWKNVPVINGRMATKAETQSESSLIFVDPILYPRAKALDMTMPRLAKFYCHSSKREEIIIVIQAINIQNDSIAGFRFLNGGNGSARLEKIIFLADSEIEKIPTSKFVTFEIDIKSDQTAISEIMRSPDHTKALQAIFDKDKSLYKSWRKTTNLNYMYKNAGIVNAAYADILFGNFYVQNDFDTRDYTEKFLLLTNEEENSTTLQIMCGPFADDYETQKTILTNWAQTVKQLAEGE